jgi:hypothetical protein
MRSIVRRVSLLIAILLAGALTLSAGASAAVDLGTGEEPPVIAYEAGTATTYVAWVGPRLHSIELCVLPGGASGCAGGAPYQLKDEAAEAGGAEPVSSAPQIVVEPGGGVVLVANEDDTSRSVAPAGYEPLGVVAWSSTAGGAGFALPKHGLADGGELLAPEEKNGFPPGAGAVALGGSDEVGVFGNENPFGEGFVAFDLTTPAPATGLPKPDVSEEYPEDLGADSGQIAALPNTPTAGKDLVVTVGSAFSHLAACPSFEHVAGYGVADTTLAKLDEEHSWEAGGPYFKPIACPAEAPVLTGGPSGIGLLEDEGGGLEGDGSDGIDYRAFDPTTLGFESPVQVSDETTHTLDGAGDLSVSQDAEGGIYAMWGDLRGFELSYSNDGGREWQTPVLTIPEAASDPIVVGVGAGNFDVAYELNGQEYAQPLNYSTLLAAQATKSSSGSGSSSGSTSTPSRSPETPPPSTLPPPPPPVTITQSATIDGNVVSLSAPNKCVRNGLISSELKVSLPSAKRKGKVVVKIYEAIFKVGNTTVIVRRTHLSNAPFKVTIHLKHVKPGTKLVLTVHALIAVHHGPKRSKTFKLTLTSCA